MRRIVPLLATVALSLFRPPSAWADDTKISVRVVVVTTFELGRDTGDIPGEFQNWVGKLPLSQEIAAPGTDHGVMRYNPSLQVLGLVTGEGPEHMASAMTGLVLDPRFDLRKAYFVLAGIGGIDPNFGPVGAAVWAPRVINGGLAHMVDAREIPKNWPDGLLPVQGASPDLHPVPALHSQWGDMGYTLNPGLVSWAYQLTRDVLLPDTKGLQASRARYRGYPQAQLPPKVMLGDTVSGETFWVGERMNRWAERWVKYWTEGKGVFATSAEEDIGFMQALSAQARAGRVDINRVLILRTASNYDMPHPGQSAAGLLQEESQESGFSGFMPSLDAAYRVGSVVVRELATRWDRYETNVPVSP
ncbi:purine nucleoside permease [Acetobacter oeni]|uniref:Purine nucleoside permease n=1 Tax=Acetobacter oeni TaxID=304077 RepID=A0A511XN70_9PROT|nr:purine nucleoside permease [Acetobacter oeni]GBR01018.1 purine nucleoside transporter [Acetobacter oeni LMG 21952]GEN64398.1 purine nucleoside permease [Acetobacter oeni]